ncbi:MAG: PAS domain-containing sensor histidine kinase [Dehalococcoidales bacterium]|nr:PAS domain-containing sensor histidine kinase [Dehalococcoidales bacterium]
MKQANYSKKSSRGAEQNWLKPDYAMRYLLDHLPQGIRIIDTHYEVRFLNQAFGKMSGVKPENATGMKCWEVFASPFCHTSQCSLARIVSEGEEMRAEMGRTRVDGSITPCVLSAFPVYKDGNKLCGIVECFQDVSDKKNTEESLREFENLYGTIFQSTGTANCIIDQMGLITRVNNQWEKTTGYNRLEVEGRMYLNEFFCSDKQTAVFVCYEGLESASSTKGENWETRMVNKSGNIRHVIVTTQTVPGYEKRVVVVIDITERKNIEEELRRTASRYKAIFECAPVSISESDYSNIKIIFDDLRSQGVMDIRQYLRKNDLNIALNKKGFPMVKLNRAAIDLWGASSASEVLSSVARSMQEKDVTFDTHCDTLARLFEGQTQFSKEDTIIDARGKQKHLWTIVTVAPGYEDILKSVYIITMDITELINKTQKLLEYEQHLKEMVAERTAELEKTQEYLNEEIERSRAIGKKLKKSLEQESRVRRELQSQIKQRIEFTRALVHELKTPLMPMLGAGEVLCEQLEEEPFSSYARMVYQGSLQLEKRIDQLLDIAKGEIGALTIDKKHFNPMKLLKNISECMMANSQKYGHKVSINIPDTMNEIHADYERLQQVLQNIVNNAFKFTPETGIVKFSSFQTGAETVFEVVDTGIGIKERDKPKLFKPYEGVLSSKYGFSGLGLGLTLSKMLVELHSGAIDIQSQKDQGTRVVVKIPNNVDFDETTREAEKGHCGF